MKLSTAFVSPQLVSKDSRVSPDAVEPETSSQGVFVDPKTLLSFPIATAVTSSLSQVLANLTGIDLKTIGFIVALLVGGLIFAITMSDRSARPKTGMAWAVAIGIAAINSLLLYAAMVGINKIK
jgi:hypothetical protein